MNGALEALGQRYAALATRERVLVVATLAAALWLLWDLVWYSWTAASVASLNREVDQVNGRIAAQIREQVALQTRSGSDPLQRLARRQRHLTGRIEEIELRYAALLGEFVDPERMPALLEDMLDRHDGLDLVALKSLPVRPVEVEVGADRKRVEGIFLHPLEITFKGRFFAVVEYLNALEALEWDFVWRSISYQVDEHPTATVVLTVETVGREEDWLGV